MKSSLRKWVSRLFGASENSVMGQHSDAMVVSKPFPTEDVVVIGDIHGRADLLTTMLQKLAKNYPAAKRIFVGDYVDRGPESKATLEILRALAPDNICLMGNHEAMLLEFLDNPADFGPRWLRNGGVETLASYGIMMEQDDAAAAIEDASKWLRNVLSEGTENWIRGLPKWWQSGNLLVTHAGPNPKLSVADQDETNFLWGHSRFLREPRTDGLWVAHGHWIQNSPTAEKGRIAVDTGAYFSGNLTAAIVKTDGSVTFIKAT
jgi:serine/threonine protein phosphatase 1